MASHNAAVASGHLLETAITEKPDFVEIFYNVYQDGLRPAKAAIAAVVRAVQERDIEICKQHEHACIEKRLHNIGAGAADCADIIRAEIDWNLS